MVTPSEQRMCQACRYNKCLEAGMKQGLVLDSVGKKQRFTKQSITRDADEQQISWDVASESSEEHFEFPDDCEHEDYSTHEGMLDPETGLIQCADTSCKSVEYEDNKELVHLDSDSQIQHYVHKKYRRNITDNYPWIANKCIEDIPLHQQSGMETKLDVTFKIPSKFVQPNQRYS